jgi:hypothetical protein
MRSRPVKSPPDAASRGAAPPAPVLGCLVLGCLALGCGEGLRESSAAVGTSRLLGPAGGRVDFAQAHLEVLPDSIDRDVLVSVRRVQDATGVTVGDAFSFGPTDFTFSMPASVSIDLVGTPPVEPARLALAGQAGPIWRRIAGSAISTDGSRVTGAVTQLVTFAIVLTCNSNEDCSSRSCDTGACQAPAAP